VWRNSLDRLREEVFRYRSVSFAEIAFQACACSHRFTKPLLNSVSFPEASRFLESLRAGGTNSRPERFISWCYPRRKVHVARPAIAHLKINAGELPEHSVRDPEVGGSNPLAPTTFLRSILAKGTKLPFD